MGRLSQGIDNVTGADYIAFISKYYVPTTKMVTYANMVCDYRSLKSKRYHVCLTVGGDKLDYDFDTTSPAASLIETKLLLNSIISN